MSEEDKKTEIQTVLCATDFSETADLALGHALRWARRHEARLILVHVVEPIPLGPYPVLSAGQSELAIQDIARKRTESIAQLMRDEGVVVETRVPSGPPGPCLVDAADEEGADLFVIGTRGLTGLKHILLGSTAEHVVRRCACPVLTIHPGDRLLEEVPKTVILPSDLLPDAVCAADFYLALLGDTKPPKVVLTFADRTPPYLEPFRHETLLKTHQRDIVKEEIERRLEGSVRHLRSAGFEVETAVLDGDPVTVITQAAEDRKADLIIMRTKKRSAVVNALLGKTAQRIVQHAPCPVLTVRP